MTLNEARKRTGLDLLSDDAIPWSWRPDSGSVRARQRDMESRYPVHKHLRRIALRYFRSRNWELYPRGVAVHGTATCLDFAILRHRRIIFVECLTEHFVYQDTIQKKRGVEGVAEIRFVVEDKSRRQFTTIQDHRDYLKRVRWLAARCVVYWCNPTTKVMRQASFS
jgi:hypothetical protein